MSNVHTRWVIQTAIEAKSAADAERLAGALEEIATVDPTFSYSMDRGSRAAVVLATDEAHLDAHLATLERLCAGAVNIGAPQVRYREALARAVDVDYTHKKLTDAGGEFARVKLRIEPSEPGSGIVFRSEITGGVVPDEYIGGAEQGVRSVCDSGVLVGYPIDAIVSLCDGAFHEIDSSWIAFEVAGRVAMRKGAAQAGVTLLEPIMDVAVEMSGECAGAVMADMHKRHLHVQNQETHGDGSVIRLDTLAISLDTIVIWGEKRGNVGVISGRRSTSAPARLRQSPALDQWRPCELHHVLQPVRGSATQRWARRFFPGHRHASLSRAGRARPRPGMEPVLAHRFGTGGREVGFGSNLAVTCSAAIGAHLR